MPLRPVLAAAAAVGLTLPAVAGVALAQAQESPLFYDGNLRFCADVNALGIEGVDLDSSIVRGTVSADGKSLDVVLLDDDFVITAVVVKGGPDSYVYVQPPYTGLVSPLNPGGQVPQISHWFVCGVEDGDDHTPTPEPTRTKTPSPKPSEPVEEPHGKPSTPAAVPTSVPAGTPGAAGPGAGSVVAGLALAGAAVAGATVAVRRRQENGA